MTLRFIYNNFYTAAIIIVSSPSAPPLIWNSIIKSLNRIVCGVLIKICTCTFMLTERVWENAMVLCYPSIALLPVNFPHFHFNAS